MKIEKTWNFDMDGTVISLTEEQARELYEMLRREFAIVETQGIDRPWSVEDLTELRERYVRGDTFPMIAHALGRSQGSVEMMAKRNGLNTRRRGVPQGAAHALPWTAEDDTRLRELRAQGHTNREIGIALGRTEGAVAVRASSLGIRRAQQIAEDAA